MTRELSLARWQATQSDEARQRARAAMDAYKDALARRPHKGERLRIRQARLPFDRQARADFAEIAHEEAALKRRRKFNK